MGKQTHKSDVSSDQDDQYYADVDDFEFDDDAFFESYSKHSRPRSKRSKDARRLIEQRREDRELQRRLDEVYFDTDDEE